MPQSYPSRASVPAGGTLSLHVSNDGRFRVDFYRVGAKLEFKQSSGWMNGASLNAGLHNTDWGWQSYDFPIPGTWSSGVYFALVVRDGAPPSEADPNDTASDSAKSLFVVTSAAPGKGACILYKIPLFTYHAYNQLGNPPGSLYTGAGLKVTMRRPGGGVSGDPWDHIFADVYEPGSFRQTFAHWDAPFIKWLETAGYQAEYCTDLDVHENQNQFLSNYRLLISVGHDEYWSAEMRANVESFVSAGGNVAFFSGNVCWWRVHLVDGNTAFVCDKSEHNGISGPFDQWWTGQNNLPENSMTGVSYRNAGGSWDGPRGLVGYTVQYAKHWVYDGVKRQDGSPIQDGDVIGNAEALVGYECDGAAIAGMPDSQGHLVAALNDGTPPSFLILGHGELPWNWQDREAGDGSSATMGLYTRGGIVFTAATTDWSRGLVNPAVDRITRNVLERLRSRSVRILGLSGACGSNAPVEGATVKFHADTTGLPQKGNLTFRWTASAGKAGPADQPTFELKLPSPPVSVTLTVTIKDGTDCSAFGTFTFTPMTMTQYEQLAIICALRRMAILAQPFRKAVQGVRDGNRWFVDPLWDPIRGISFVPIARHDVQQIVNEARKTLELAVGFEKRLINSETSNTQHSKG